MNKLGILVLMMIIFSGCSREQVCGVGDTEVTKVTAEDVSVSVGDSEDDTHEIPATIGNIGGQLLKIAYDEYHEKGLGEKDIGRLPESRFRDNLMRLYRDVESVIE